MPYPGVPASRQADMESCVRQVMAQGHDKSSAIAICHDSIMGKQTKAGARHSRTDNEMLQSIHDTAVSLGAMCTTEKAAPMKSEGDGKHPSSHYLVVEDSTKPSTWHLRVRGTDGNPDHALMGAAWAALYSGYRGNVYEGPNKQQAIGKLKRLYEQEDMTLPSEKASQLPATFFTTKDAKGNLRWVLISSSAYRDQDKEIVSLKALKADVKRADADGSYGPLRWWHVDGAELGECDFNAMHGRMLVESGTFKGQTVAERVAARAPELGASLGFYHPITEPDKDGVYHSIHRFERSLLPKERASNLLTSLTVKEDKMNQAKVEALRQLLGEELAGEVLAGATATDKAAQEKGIAFKEVGLTKEAAVGLLNTIFKDGPPTQEPAPEEEADPLAPFVEDDDEEEAEEESEGEAKEADAPLTVGALKAALAEFSQQLATSTKEAEATRQKEAEARFEKIENGVKAVVKQMRELKGEQPRALKAGFRPSQSEETIVGTKEQEPSTFDEIAANSVGSFGEWLRTQNGRAQG